MGSNGQIAKNTAFLYVRMFIVLAVSLYTSRVVLHALDVVDYGINNVVAGFVSMFGFLEGTLSSGIQRFYNFVGTRRGAEGFKEVFSEGMVIQICVSAILIVLLETAGLWYVNHMMVIPPERIRAANFLFQFSTLSLLLVMIQVPFNGAIIAREKMGYFAIVSIVEVLLKLGIALLIAHYNHDRLILYGGLLLGVSAITTMMMIVYCRLNFKDLRFKKTRNTNLIKEFLSFSGWSMLGTFAFMLKGQGLNMLLNLFFGPAINAARGLTYQISGAIFGFSSNITMAYRPQLVNEYAAGRIEHSRALMFSESKICFGLIALLSTPVIIEMDTLLHLWLGETVPAYTGIFASLVLIDTLICTLNAPCTQAVYAVGKIRRYQIWTTLLNLCLLPVCWFLLKSGYPPESVFIATIIFSCILQTISLILTKEVFPFEWKDYLNEVLLRCIAITILLPALPFLIHLTSIAPLWRLLLVCVTTVVIALPLFCFLLLNSQERSSFFNLVKRFFHNTHPD